MNQAVVAGALAVAALNAVAAALGGWAWWRPSAPPQAPAAQAPAAQAPAAQASAAQAPAAQASGGPPARERPSSRGPAGAFWVALRIGQGAALALALAIGSLAAAGHESSERLFYLYALLPLAVAFVAEQLRVTAAQAILDQRDLADAQAVGRLPAGEQLAVVAAIVHREVGVMAASALVVVFLALRAAGTAHGF